MWRVKAAGEERERFVAPRIWQKVQLQRVAEREPWGLRETWAV